MFCNLFSSRLLLVLVSALLFWGFESQAQDNQEVVNQIQGKAATPDSDWSRWSVSYFNFSTAPVEVQNHGSASWNIYQYLSLNYKLSDHDRVALRPSFTTQTAGISNSFGDSRPMLTRGDDFHVAYSNYELASFPGEWNLSGTFYWYFPTSENSQNKRWYSRVKSWMILEHKINRDWTLTYNAKPEYFFQSQKAYRKETTATARDGSTYTKVSAENNQMAALDHYFELSRYVNKYFTPQLAVGFKHEWSHTSEEADSRPSVSESFKIAPSTWVFVNKKLKFIAGIENSVAWRDRDRNGEGFALFREKDNTYYVMTFWTIL